MSDVSKINAMAALVEQVGDPFGWLSDAQGAQLEHDQFNSSIRFCGEGSIDLNHMIDIVLADALEAATRVPVQGEPECECWPTEEKYHFVHFGATEPGSAIEHNPECPEHGETLEKIVSDYAAALYTMEETLERISRASVPDAATELRAERDALREVIDRLRELHIESQTTRIVGNKIVYRAFRCAGCRQPYPCPTIQALDGAPEPEEKP